MWYAAYTKPRFEKKVAEHLAKKKINYYLPLIKTLKQWSDRKKWVEEPAFKSYIFVNVSEEDVKHLTMVDGIIKVIAFNGKPQPIPEDQIQTLQLLLNNPELIEISHSLVDGDNVEITTGPLAGIKGVITTTDSPKNVAVNINILGRSILAQIPAYALKKIPKRS